MSVPRLRWASQEQYDGSAYQFQLMLLFLQEANGSRHGHREGDKFDRLSICLHAYAETFWRGSLERHPFIRV
uniref:Uncharacterized protein n=1 Tax=Bosea sp. NBC_00436 TaxID=2969620 RepID=A0A9E7ZVS5_9HYPH